MKKPLRESVAEVVRIYIDGRVSKSAAALSYSLTMSLFPLLICVSAILGGLHLSDKAIFNAVEKLVPEGVATLLNDFLTYIGTNKSIPLLVFGVFVMITTSSAAFRTILNTFGDIQGKKRFGGIFGAILSFIMSIAFLAAIYLSGLVVVSGEWLMQWLENAVSIGGVLALWKWLRFVILFLMLFVVIYAIYFVSAPKETKRIHRLPGAALSSVLIVMVSLVFSRMISESIKYELVYGSIASFIILMVWIYLCSIVLIMGNVINIVFADGGSAFQNGE